MGMQEGDEAGLAGADAPGDGYEAYHVPVLPAAGRVTVKSRAAPVSRLGGHVPLVLANDAVHRRQPEAGALRLGREERLEYVLQVLGKLSRSRCRPR